MPPTATARIPGSKSVTARALVIAALTPGRTRLLEPLVAADTVAFATCVSDLGLEVRQEPGVWTVSGNPGGPPAGKAKLWCHDSGTAARFLPALAALGRGSIVVDASEQMRARPMAALLSALRDLGVRVRSAPGDRLPLEIDADGIQGGAVELDAGISSQYLTALCLIAPATREGLRITLKDVVSVPYVELTLAMMRDFGVEADWTGDTIVIPPGVYRSPADYRVEADASTASYFFAAAALTGSAVTVPGLGTGAQQGDLRFATQVLASMGCRVEQQAGSTTVTGPAQLRSPGTVVMRDISDTMMTLAAIAPFADAPVRIVDVANCRVKESDRIDAMATALTACGTTVLTGPDWIEIRPGRPHGARVATRADHRIAMALSVTGLRTPGIELDDPGCVAKTFPGFHEEFAVVRETWGV